MNTAPDPNRWTRAWAEPRLLWLALPALAYVALALGQVLSFGGDLARYDAFLRWQEIQHVLAGVDPRDVIDGRAPALAWVGAPRFSYAPWSYILAAPMLPPVEPALALGWFMVVNFAALGLLLAWTWSEARPLGPRAAAGLILAVCTTLTVSVGLRHLNYAIVVCGAVAGYAWLERRSQPVLAGLALSLALLKPQVGGLFFLVPLVRRSWATLGTAAAVLAAATLGAAALVGKDPVTMALAMFSEGSSYQDAYLGLLDSLHWLGVERGAIVLLGGLLGLGAVGGALIRFRPSLVTALAVAACGATLWSYQRTFDLLVVAFLVLALGLNAFRLDRPRDWQVFWLVGVSYWVPYLVRFSTASPLPELFRATWILGCVHLLRSGRASTREATQ